MTVNSQGEGEVLGVIGRDSLVASGGLMDLLETRYWKHSYHEFKTFAKVNRFSRESRGSDLVDLSPNAAQPNDSKCGAFFPHYFQGQEMI